MNSQRAMERAEESARVLPCPLKHMFFSMKPHPFNGISVHSSDRVNKASAVVDDQVCVTVVS